MRRLEVAALSVICAHLHNTSLCAKPVRHRPASRRPAEIAGWNIDVGRDGSNLPPGSGSVSHGREVFAQQCAGLPWQQG